MPVHHWGRLFLCPKPHTPFITVVLLEDASPKWTLVLSGENVVNNTSPDPTTTPFMLIVYCVAVVFKLLRLKSNHNNWKLIHGNRPFTWPMTNSFFVDFSSSHIRYEKVHCEYSKIKFKIFCSGFRCCLWVLMTIARHLCSPLARLIKIFRFRIWLELPKFSRRSIGKLRPTPYSLAPSPTFRWLFYSIFNLYVFREKLCGHLPARAEGYSWSLVFSTSQHGFSLNSLYRKLQRIESPILIVIQDTESNVSWISPQSPIKLTWHELLFSRFLARSHHAPCTYPIYFMALANHFYINLIRVLKYFIGLVKTCILSRGIRRAYPLVLESKSIMRKLFHRSVS